MISFVVIYVCSGIYFSLIGIPHAFDQLSPTVAIIPAVILAWLLYPGNKENRLNALLDGARHRDIIMMCFIFLLAGAFSAVSQAIGSVDATIHLVLATVPPRFLLLAIFVTTAFISTAIGSSMGTIATVAPIAAGLSSEGAFPMALGMATVVGGSMFGDNLSMISDTTIAAVTTQDADIWEKSRLNSTIAMIASIFTLITLFFCSDATNYIPTYHQVSPVLISPYFFILGLVCLNINVFSVFIFALGLTGIVGYLDHGYSLFLMCQHISQGFASMHEIIFLSLMVGGLAGLTKHGAKYLTQFLEKFISFTGSRRVAQLVIAQTVSFFDLLLTNNTVAIICSGQIAKNLCLQYRIPPHYSATWLSIFSCVFQGLLPYGAQMLLASTLGNISPLSIMPHVYYCYILGIVATLYILCDKTLDIRSNTGRYRGAKKTSLSEPKKQPQL